MTNAADLLKFTSIFKLIVAQAANRHEYIGNWLYCLRDWVEPPVVYRSGISSRKLSKNQLGERGIREDEATSEDPSGSFDKSGGSSARSKTQVVTVESGKTGANDSHYLSDGKVESIRSWAKAQTVANIREAQQPSGD
jgi:hypothetical protein